MESNDKTPSQENQNKSYDMQELNRFLTKLVNLSDPTIDIFLNSYLEVCRKTVDFKDRELKLKSLLDFLSFIRHGYFNIYKFDSWGKGEIEEVTPELKTLIDNIMEIIKPIMERGLLEELRSLSNESLPLLRYYILTFLRSLTFMSQDYSRELSNQDKQELFTKTYLKALMNKNQNYSESLSFHIALGIILYIELEQFQRISAENKINPKDIRTQASAPFIFIAFELARRNENSKIQNLVLTLLKRACDITSKGIYHPDDPEYTKDSKFPENIGTEAEGLFDELFTVLLTKQKLSELTYEGLFKKVYEFKYEFAYLSHKYRSNLLNMIESHQAKTTGLSVKELRNIWIKKDGNTESPEYMQDQYPLGYSRKVPIAHTEPEYVEGRTTEYCPPDIMYPTQYSYREYTEAKEDAIVIFKIELEKLPFNATKKKKVCEIIIEKLQSPDSNLNVKNVAKLAGATERTVHNLLRYVLDKHPSIKNLTS